jgi:CO/xanthine dehydrogenase FAD-binding subunit
MVSFDYIKPTSLKSLIDDISEAKLEGAVLAGGTDLINKIRSGLISKRVLYDINDLQEMGGIDDKGDFLRIGAAVRMREIADSQTVQSALPFLSLAAGQMGSPQIRNQATVGGNIASASPCADTVPPLMAAGARLRLSSKDADREVSLEDFMQDAGRTIIRDHEVLTDIIVPKLSAGCRSHFVKVGRRKAMAISVINLAGWAKKDSDGMLEDIKIVLGSVAPTAFRAKGAEAVLKGEVPTDSALQEAARKAAAESLPISDIRGTENERRLLVEAWTFRLLQVLTS